MSKLGKAIALTSKVFEEKTDLGGYPYIMHCLYVMNNVEGNEDVKCAAVLHDVIEDTNITYNEISEAFGDEVVDILRVVTHNSGESYEEYIKRISGNYAAICIKMVDLEHNSMITRLKGVRQKDINRMEKYHKAYLFLKECKKAFPQLNDL